MKRLRNMLLHASAVLAAPLLVASMPLLAQDVGSSSSPAYSGLRSSSVYESKSSEIPRLWGGLTGSYTPFKMVKTTSQTNSTTQEQISSQAANGQVGGGVMLNYRLFRGYWLSVGAIYRFGGYDTTDAVNANTIYLERTRAHFLDFPALIRYSGPHFRWNKYSFYEAGATIRRANDVHIDQIANNGAAYYCCAPPSTTAIHRTIEGVTVGTGIAGKDDFGIIVAPEVRYTYWMGNTFSSPTVSTMKNQLELTISFGF
jgi:hypothetical protein